jgi:hypothetical protein
MSFYDEVIRKSSQFDSAARVSSLDMLEPTMRASVSALILDAASRGIKLMVFETYRSRQRQEALYQQGATQLRQVGVHHFGLAVDLVKDIDGEPSWKGSFDFMSVLSLRHNLVWGGTFKGFYDACHLQRVAVEDQARLFAGGWYPDANYAPFAGATLRGPVRGV